MVDAKERVKVLCNPSITFDASIDPAKYFKSGREILKMATLYHEDGDLEKALTLYSKYLILFVEKMPNHPHYKSVSVKERLHVAKKLKDVVLLAENVKGKLIDKYEAEECELEVKVNNCSVIQRIDVNHDDEKDCTSVKDELEEMKHKVYEEREKMMLIARGNSQEIEAKTDSKNTSSDDVKPEIPSRISKPVFKANAKPNSLNRISYPSNLIDRFLSCVYENTVVKNVETGGYLFATIATTQFSSTSRDFTITHLVIPKQKGFADSFSCEEEEEMLKFQSTFPDLVSVGWIHTHPSQSAFLSSVDLHNHHPYQLLLPEYFAIVCAPTHSSKRFGIFRITSPYGMNILSKCTKTGFHLHDGVDDESMLFEETNHVNCLEVKSDVSLTLVDMRQ